MFNRGLAKVSKEVRLRVSTSGGNAPHKQRGLQTTDPEKRKEIARKGGLARGKQRREEKARREAQ